MAKELKITLSDIKVKYVHIRDESPLGDWTKIVMAMPFNVMQDDGRVYDTDEASSFQTLPHEGEKSWYEMPEEHAEKISEAILHFIGEIKERKGIV